MNKFLSLPEKHRRDAIIQTAAKLNMEPAAVEKDFWVCWMLQRLFHSKLAESIIFKGGTSLSKVYGLIKRFSEDIDLILNWDGFCRSGDWNPGVRYGKSRREEMLRELDAWNVREIATSLLPIVKECCGETCTAHISEEEPESILVGYPKLWNVTYIRPEIKLEIGPKAAWNPNEEHTIVPYVAEVYPHLFSECKVRVRATTDERAFWEKVTILHAQVNRLSPLPKRYARHYYDTIMMARNTDLKQRAFRNVTLLYQVASFKYYFYRAGWADYPNAQPGSMHLMPQEHILEELKSDYDAMRLEMLPPDAPDLATLLDELQTLETEINQLTPLSLDIRNYPTLAPLA